jgi:hypothetical protein
MDIDLQQSVVHTYYNLGKWFIEFNQDIIKAEEYYQKAFNLSESILYIDGKHAAENGLNDLSFLRSSQNECSL